MRVREEEEEVVEEEEEEEEVGWWWGREGGRDETDEGELTEVSLLLCILSEHFVDILAQYRNLEMIPE